MRNLWLITGVVLLCGVVSLEAKSRVRKQYEAFNRLREHTSSPNMTSFEQTLTPYLRHRRGLGSGAHHQSRTNLYTPTQADLFALARQWDNLSQAFKSDYLAAFSIPRSMDAFITPSGHFEVYYTTSGFDAVHELDTMGFSATNWRVEVSGANGIPDYVDQAGFALDSAWSMIVERFQFVKPFPYTDTRRQSSRYKVVLRDLPEGYYGMTYPLGKVHQDVGYASYVEIRNNWDGWNLGEGLDYQNHPHLAIRITAAHEFFHSIQYSMTRSVSSGVLLDDFPVSWLEATAVLMEDLAFPEINDYVQYTGSFFTDPKQPLLDDFYDGYDEYKNVLLSKFLYQFPGNEDSIGFIRQTFYNNLERTLPFYENLELSAGQVGTSWAQCIGAFHGGSFFTGSRAAGLFVDDAPLFRTWDYTKGFAEINTTKDYSVNNHSLVPVSILKTPTHGSTLLITATKSDQSSENAPLAVSVLLRRPDDTMRDTIIFRTVKNTDTQKITIENWDHFQEAITVVSNADLYATQKISLTFTTSINSAKPTNSSPELVMETEQHIEAVAVYTVTGRLVTRIESSGSRPLTPEKISGANLRDQHNLAAGSYLLHIIKRNQQSGASSPDMKRITVH